MPAIAYKSNSCCGCCNTVCKKTALAVAGGGPAGGVFTAQVRGLLVVLEVGVFQ